MFGGRRNNNDKNDGESLSTVMSPPDNSSRGKSSVTGFDPEGLERAAKAARDLDKSRNSSAAIELIKTQEITKQVRALIMYERNKIGRIAEWWKFDKDSLLWAQFSFAGIREWIFVDL